MISFTLEGLSQLVQIAGEPIVLQVGPRVFEDFQAEAGARIVWTDDDTFHVGTGVTVHRMKMQEFTVQT